MKPEPPSGRVSMRQLARRLGISHAAVSMALQDSPRISEATKANVREMAESMGYRPDPMMVALNRYRTGKERAAITTGIAWINAWHDPAELRSFREFDCYWKGACAAADKLGYRIEEFRIDVDCSPRRLHQVLQARGIHAILLPPQDPHPDWGGGVPWHKYSVVRFGRSLQIPACHVVTSDHVANTLRAFTTMRERGYERIGFATDERRVIHRGHLFEAGFLVAQRMVEEKFRLPVFVFSENATRKGAADRTRWADALQQWVHDHRPDAILTDIDALADLMGDIGLPVPGPIGLAVTSVLDAKADAGIDQNPEEIGRVGTLMLHSLVTDSSRGIPVIFRQVLVEGSWVDGESLPVRSR